MQVLRFLLQRKFTPPKIFRRAFLGQILPQWQLFKVIRKGTLPRTPKSNFSLNTPCFVPVKIFFLSTILFTEFSATTIHYKVTCQIKFNVFDYRPADVPRLSHRLIPGTSRNCGSLDVP